MSGQNGLSVPSSSFGWTETLRVVPMANAASVAGSRVALPYPGQLFGQVGAIAASKRNATGGPQLWVALGGRQANLSGFHVALLQHRAAYP